MKNLIYHRRPAWLKCSLFIAGMLLMGNFLMACASGQTDEKGRFLALVSEAGEVFDYVRQPKPLSSPEQRDEILIDMRHQDGRMLVYKRQNGAESILVKFVDLSAGRQESLDHQLNEVSRHLNEAMQSLGDQGRSRVHSGPGEIVFEYSVGGYGPTLESTLDRYLRQAVGADPQGD